MRNLICWCPETQQPINLQIYTDYATLARIWCISQNAIWTEVSCLHGESRAEAGR
jgi:hypothetical protein